MLRRPRLVAYGICAGLAAAFLVTTTSACNEHAVSLQQQEGVVEFEERHDLGGGEELDLLWMIDNSGSMCRSQQVVRESIDDFIDILTDVNLDFHISTTTTHMLGDHIFEDSAVNPADREPVAQPGHLQATPQPIPGTDGGRNPGTCHHDIYRPGDPEVEDGLIEAGQANIESLELFDVAIDAAIECTEEPDDWEHLRDYDEEAVRCHSDIRAVNRCNEDLHSSDADYCICPPSDDHGFTNCFDCPSDDTVIEDFFPDPEAYRDIPLVLRADDYRDDDGAFDTEEFRRDFSCMSFVGTRGWGIERGLDAVVQAVSPEMTGGVPAEDIDDLEAMREEYPNAGFLRRDANTGVIFISDENDCSHGGDYCISDCTDDQFQTDGCGVGQCTIQENLGDDGVLVDVEDLADQFVDNLAVSKGHIDEDDLDGLDDDEDPIDRHRILPASIHAPYNRDFDAPAMCPDDGYDPPVACRTDFGRGWSGHRYEFFLRQFHEFFPRPADGNNINTSMPLSEADEDPNFEPLDGNICQEFSGVLAEIAEFFQAEAAGCLENAAPCSGPDDTSCPDNPHTGDEGQCLPYPAFDGGDDDAHYYCDTGIEIRLGPRSEDQTRDDINDTGYCIEGSFGDPNYEDTCVVDPVHYNWVQCEDNDEALLLDWDDPDWQVDIGHLELITRYVRRDLADQQDDAGDNGDEDNGNDD